VDLTDEFDNEELATKRVMREVPGFTEAPAPVVLTAEERYELDQLERRPKPKPIHDETKIELSPEQEEVVNLAMQKNNIFLTGAAGCGKTVTLKEILARLKKKTTGGNVQVVAPTGIAALPLEGKTTYSFAGVSGNLLKGAGRRSNLSGSGIQTHCGKALMNYLSRR
jgi:ABC-type glutathione transport system ATPase component